MCRWCLFVRTGAVLLMAVTMGSGCSKPDMAASYMTAARVPPAEGRAGRGGAADAGRRARFGSGDEAGAAVPKAPAGSETPSAELAAQVDTSAPAAQRILIYTAALELAVADIPASLAAAQTLAENAGGYLQAMTSESITVRVPAKKFFEVVDQVQKLGQMLTKAIQAQDVTDEFVDLQLRLKNAEALRDRLVVILEKAQTVKEMLEVERELNRVREEIERIKGRLTMLERQIAFSTIEVRFTQATSPVATRRRPPSPFAWLDRLGVETLLQIEAPRIAQ